MLSKLVLVRGINTLAQARYAAGMMVDYISFEFDKIEDQIVCQSPINEFSTWINGVKIIGVGSKLKQLEINQIVENYQLDGFLFNENQIEWSNNINCKLKFVESNLIFDQIKNFDYLISVNEISDNIKNLRVYDFSKTSNDNDNIDGFVIDTDESEASFEQLINALEQLDI